MASDNTKNIDLFKRANIATVQRIIKRATDKENRKAQRPRLGGHLKGSRLVRVLKTALLYDGRSRKNQPSIRLKSPTTGGRPFHFGFTSINKNTNGSKNAAKAQAASSKGKSGATGSKSGSTAKKTRFATLEAAHQNYIERDRAVSGYRNPIIDELIDQPQRNLSKGQTERDPAELQPDTYIKESLIGKSNESDMPELDLGIGTTKTYNAIPQRRYGRTHSFGTIAERFEDRAEFWSLVNEHEREKDARTQNRLVLELPHEATDQMRFEMVLAFVKEFESKGVPYWASLHEPGPENDDRNYHAHVVFTDRPMAKLEDQNGNQQWDFAITESHKKKNRVTIVRHPYRQNKNGEMRQSGYVKKLREKFSDDVNLILAKHQRKPLYDPRSYKNMGLDQKPMANVARILMDKSKTQKFKVLDPEWTARLVETEMNSASMRQSKTFEQLRDTEHLIQELEKDPTRIAKINKFLPKHMRISPAHQMGRNTINKLAKKILRSEQAELTNNFLEQSTEQAMQKIIRATATTTKDIAMLPIGINDDEIRILHQAAIDELAWFRSTRKERRSRYRLATNQAQQAWNEQASPFAEEAKQKTKKTESEKAIIEKFIRTKYTPSDHPPWEPGNKGSPPKRSKPQHQQTPLAARASHGPNPSVALPILPEQDDYPVVKKPNPLEDAIKKTLDTTIRHLMQSDTRDIPAELNRLRSTAKQQANTDGRDIRSSNPPTSEETKSPPTVQTPRQTTTTEPTSKPINETPATATPENTSKDDGAGPLFKNTATIKKTQGRNKAKQNNQEIDVGKPKAASQPTDKPDPDKNSPGAKPAHKAEISKSTSTLPETEGQPTPQPPQSTPPSKTTTRDEPVTDKAVKQETATSPDKPMTPEAVEAEQKRKKQREARRRALLAKRNNQTER